MTLEERKAEYRRLMAAPVRVVDSQHLRFVIEEPKDDTFYTQERIDKLRSVIIQNDSIRIYGSSCV